MQEIKLLNVYALCYFHINRNGGIEIVLSFLENINHT